MLTERPIGLIEELGESVGMESRLDFGKTGG